MLPEVTHQEPTDKGDEQARGEAVQAIGRRRRFWSGTMFSGIAMAIVVAIWAVTEYHNAGGWPTQGFSQSSGAANVWNIWIVYPLIAWVLLTAGAAWRAFGRRPISEDEIKREIARQSGSQRG